jgi:prepilin-type N-terminal cleavage/methylation domain-containing protein
MFALGRSFMLGITHPKATTEAVSRTRAFTLLELLVVVAVIAILATLLFPALSKSKFAAKNTICRSNVRQQLVGLAVYAENHDAYPPHQYDLTPWQELLELRSPLREKITALSCPLGKGLRFDNGHMSEWDGFWYAYNAFGITGNGNAPHNPFLGLSGSGNFVGNFGRPTKPSAVRVPVEMLALGDAADRSLDPSWDGHLFHVFMMPLVVGDKRIQFSHLPKYLPKQQPTFQNHRGRFNRGLLDGHSETEDFNKPFDPSDSYLSRYNSDHEPHRDLWLQAAAGF